MKRFCDYGYRVGSLPSGELDKITDVPGVTVGHATIQDERHHTGVTVIMPCEDNMFTNKLTAASFVLNGFGKTLGLVQVDELGTLETPIALTNTLNVGLVHDALVTYMAERCAREGVELRSLNPVVGECNDASLNAIVDRPVTARHVLDAIADARRDFEEGAVGAGAGTTCHELKGGIGSASRVVRLGREQWTLGVLVQSNHGCLQELTVLGRRVGEEILARRRTAVSEQPQDLGSILMVVATDMPVNDRQLRRILKRCAVGLARNGSYFGHGSGDIMVGFTTANRVPHISAKPIAQQILPEAALETAFRAAAEATQEAVLNSMVCAQETRGADGRVWESLAKYL